MHSEEIDPFIPGYILKKQKIRKKTNNGPKISGGLAVFAKKKKNVSDQVHVVPNTNENSIWVKIKKKIIRAIRTLS